MAPRDPREPDGELPGQNVIDDDEGVGDGSDGSDASTDEDSDSEGESDSEGGGGEPDGGDRRARLRQRRRHRILLRRRANEERLLEREIRLRDQVSREVEIMESRVQELRRQRASDLAELQALEAEPPDDGGHNEVGGPVSSDGHTPVDTAKTEAEKTEEDVVE